MRKRRRKKTEEEEEEDRGPLENSEEEVTEFVVAFIIAEKASARGLHAACCRPSTLCR